MQFETRPALRHWVALIVIVVVILWLGGCASAPVPGHAMADQALLPHRPRAQSWDQENLYNLGHRAHDTLCPTSIYAAPGGNLEQCL